MSEAEISAMLLDYLVRVYHGYKCHADSKPDKAAQSLERGVRKVYDIWRSQAVAKARRARKILEA